MFHASTFSLQAGKMPQPREEDHQIGLTKRLQASFDGVDDVQKVFIVVGETFAEYGSTD